MYISKTFNNICQKLYISKQLSILEILLIIVVGSCCCTPSMATKGKVEKLSMKKADSEAMRQSDKKKGGRHEPQFPTTLEEFGYEFNENGELRNMKTGEPFEFNVSEDHSYNQKHYEALGEVITQKVYELLESKGNLKKEYIPVDSKKTDPCSFIFLSEDALSNPDKLLVLIHGSGVVRAGQWTRKLIINEDLDHGTQLPYIKKGMEEGYGIIVLNTNLNHVTVNGKEKPIKHNSSPDDHGVYVWDTFIKKAKAKHIAIVAHSYGGVVTVEMARHFISDFESRVFAVAFTDSVHGVSMAKGDKAIGRHFEQKAVNWVTSSDARDTEMRSWKGDAKRVSAGHEKHEWTSWAAFESVFKYFNKMYAKATGQAVVEEAEAGDSKKQKVEKGQEVFEDGAKQEEEAMEFSDQEKEEINDDKEAAVDHAGENEEKGGDQELPVGEDGSEEQTSQQETDKEQNGEDSDSRNQEEVTESHPENSGDSVENAVSDSDAANASQGEGNAQQTVKSEL